MSYRVNFDQSNKSDFVVDISATDADTGASIDFTGAEVAIKIIGDNHCVVVDATIANGMITQPSSTVLELTVPAATMKNIWPGTYRIGGVYSLDGGVTVSQLFTGEFVVYDGIASL